MKPQRNYMPLVWTPQKYINCNKSNQTELVHGVVNPTHSASLINSPSSNKFLRQVLLPAIMEPHQSPSLSKGFLSPHPHTLALISLTLQDSRESLEKQVPSLEVLRFIVGQSTTLQYCTGSERSKGKQKSME